jgi:hypothetical protein
MGLLFILLMSEKYFAPTIGTKQSAFIGYDEQEQNPLNYLIQNLLLFHALFIQILILKI